MPKSDEDGLYEVPRDYEALLGSDDADLPYYLTQARAVGGPILDLATGAGRVALALAAAGREVWGVDASAPMLDLARTRALALGLTATWAQADLRDFHLGRGFALALLPYNGLQHLAAADDLDAFFGCLREHLPKGGRFALDLHLPQPALLARDPDERYGLDRRVLTQRQEQVVAEQSRWDPAGQVLTQTWILQDPQGTQRRLRLALRQFFPQELRRLLESQGFGVLAHHGGFDGRPLDRQALKQVLLAERL